MDNIENGVEQGIEQDMGGQQDNNASGGFGNMEDKAADSMANQEVDKFANDMGVPSGMDGAINSEVDQEVNKNI